MIKDKKKWKVAMYLRLSRDDGDKNQSLSIGNQRQIIERFLYGKKEFQIVSTKIDDGYTGSNFNRPAFKEMMEEVRDGKVDCIIVKDLSRFGREHIESSKYIEQVFPFMEVRFIAVNDGYDSLHEKESDSIVIPFSNLMNDHVCKDISIKTRSTIKVKCQNGEFVSSFAPYGYKKDTENKNKLVIDMDACQIVQKIFSYKIKGMSADAIADELNKVGILSPMEYKIASDTGFNTTFKTKNKAKWSAKAILRMLSNPVYIGTLAQCKRTTPSHKVKKVINKSKDEWIVVKKCHEPIITENQFKLVQRLLKYDTRISPSKKELYIFSGLIYCGLCGEPMTIKTSHSGGKKYTYYVCSGKIQHKNCSCKNIRIENLEEAVFNIFSRHIKNVVELENCITRMEKLPLIDIHAGSIKKQIELKKKEIEKYIRINMSLAESKVANVIRERDYKMMTERYSFLIEELENQLKLQEYELEKVLSGNNLKTEWIKQFKAHRNIQELDRGIVVTLIDTIKIFDNREVKITMNYADEFELLIKAINHNLHEKEVAQ